MAKNRDVSLDVIRALSILYIVGFWHLVSYSGLEYKNALTYRLTVVALGSFVFVSGYLLGSKSAPAGLVEVASFYRQRFWRIYVPFAVATVLFIVAGYGDRDALIKGLALVSMFLGPPAFTLWFASMIVVLYLVTPGLLWLRLKPWLFWLVSVGVVLALVGLSSVAPAVDGRMALYLPCFIAGIWIGGQNSPSPERWWAPLVLLAAAAILPTLFVAPEALEFSVLCLPLALFGALAFVAVAKVLPWSSGLARAAFFVSAASYFMYLSHRLVYGVAAAVSPMQPGWGTLAMFILLLLPATIIVSYYAQQVYDALLDRFIAPKKTLISPA